MAVDLYGSDNDDDFRDRSDQMDKNSRSGVPAVDDGL